MTTFYLKSVNQCNITTATMRHERARLYIIILLLLLYYIAGKFGEVIYIELPNVKSAIFYSDVI